MLTQVKAIRTWAKRNQKAPVLYAYRGYLHSDRGHGAVLLTKIRQASPLPVTVLPALYLDSYTCSCALIDSLLEAVPPLLTGRDTYNPALKKPTRLNSSVYPPKTIRLKIRKVIVQITIS